MRTTTLEIERLGPKSVITADRLRVDIGAEFHVRVEDTGDAVATAAQALGQKTFRADAMADVLEGKLVDAMLSVAARRTMDELQDDRAGYVREVNAALEGNLARNGLLLESVSLTRLDQTPFHALDENNAFNALGMRRLAEVIATNKKERAAIEADADVSVRQTQLDASKRRLTIGLEEEAAMIAQRRDIEVARARGMAETAEEQARSEERREAARIARERAVRQAALEAELATETAKSENAVTLAARRATEARAEAEAAAAKGEEARAAEAVTTARETAQAEREKALALIRAAERAEVDDARVRSEADTVRAMAEAEAKATVDRAAATRDRLLAEAEGRAKVFAAENEQSDAVLSFKLDEARLRALPAMVESMMKPAEKIEGIRINHVTGFGGSGGCSGSSGSDGAVNQVVDGMLAMALQMPAVRKLGEEVGLNIADGVSGLSASLDRPKPKPSPDAADD